MDALAFLILGVLIPIWFAYTVIDPRGPTRRRRVGQIDPLNQSVQLPPRRRFPRRRSRREVLEFRPSGNRNPQGPSLPPQTAHPLWDRWIDS
jgi:hypothetical protein